METTYPQFYRKGFTCIFRENDVKGEQIEIPDPQRVLSLIRTKLTYPDKGRFDKTVMAMEQISKEIYDRYTKTYRKLLRTNPKVLKMKGFSFLESELVKNQSRIQ